MDSQGYLQKYYSENARELRRMADRILQKFGGISQKDVDDFYSIANEVFTEVLERYNGSQEFESLLYASLLNKFKSEMTARNTMKRRASTYAVSIHTPVGNQGCTLADVLQAEFCMEEMIEQRDDRNIREYFRRLTRIQREMAQMLMDGYTKTEIREALRLTERSYEKNFGNLCCYENIRLLEDKRTDHFRKGAHHMVTTKTNQKDKTERYPISTLYRKLADGKISTDHPLQRNSGQWRNREKYTLITTILNHYRIPEVIFAEQSDGDVTLNWLIDGLQRLTIISDFRNNRFKIGKGAERSVVQYQITQKDSKGRPLKDEKGIQKYEMRECDVTGMHYRDLPEELKEEFDDYNICAVIYLNCSDEDIEYHIRRYNASRPMNAAQKGVTYLGRQFSFMVKDLSREHIFFREKGSYKPTEFQNGTIDRVVIESIMNIWFLPDWKKKQDEMCTYLKGKISEYHFNELRKILDRLAKIVDDRVQDMFSAKDSFLWFALFDRFADMGLDDSRFTDFMAAFKEGLHSQKRKGQSYDELNEKSTKDKAIVTAKMDHLEALMKEYFQITAFLVDKEGISV